jgi:hypothetical protein
VTFGTSLKLGIGVVAAFALLAGCGGGDGGGMSATLGADGCAYEGDPTPPGSFTVDLENRTSKFGAFALAGIEEGAPDEELPAFLEHATRAFAQTGGLPDPPGYYSQVERVGVGAASRSRLPADVPPGTYVLTCFVDDPPTWRGYVAARLDVGR